MNNREIIEQIIDAFDRNDNEAILSYMADDIEWQMLGDESISGKGNMRAMFSNASMKMISSTKEHIIVDGNNIAVNGEVVCTDKEGKEMNMYYCDIYELENGKVRKMITFGIQKK